MTEFVPEAFRPLERQRVTLPSEDFHHLATLAVLTADSKLVLETTGMGPQFPVADIDPEESVQHAIARLTTDIMGIPPSAITDVFQLHAKGKDEGPLLGDSHPETGRTILFLPFGITVGDVTFSKPYRLYRDTAARTAIERHSVFATRDSHLGILARVVDRRTPDLPFYSDRYIRR